MEIILTLLISAMHLKAALFGVNIPQDFRDQSMPIVDSIISQLNVEMQKAIVVSNSPSVPVPQYIAPVTPQTNSVPTGNTDVVPVVVVSAPVNKSDMLVTITNISKPDPINNLPYGDYSIKVSVLDTNGKYVQGIKDGNYIESAKIVMSSPDNLLTNKVYLEKYPNGITSSELSDWSAGFQYIPTTVGSKTLIFTSGSLTRSIVIEVK